MYFPFPIKIAIPLLFVTIFQNANGQQPPSFSDSLRYSNRIKFVQEASYIITNSIKERDWVSLQYFTENWKNAGASNPELLFCINTLLMIENNRFSFFQLPCDFMYFLEDYSKELRIINSDPNNFQYKIILSKRYWYDASTDVRSIMAITQSWALALIGSNKLNNSELFLCKIFAGVITQPRATYNSQKEKYADLKTFEDGINKNNQFYFINQRNKKTATTGIMVGAWMPTGNLKLLGTHPSVGLILGGRNKKNEYDLIWAYRFLSPSMHDYQFLRNDTLYNSSHYDGGYIGFDYTRYIIHKTRYELGFTTAIGYDYFEVVDGMSGSNSGPDLNPINIGSFDFSNGIRLKYFLGPRSYIGLAAKYHLINYNNDGGTDMGGNAFTIDLIFGSH